MKHLKKSNKNSVLFGVCGGLGEYFGVDPILFRLGFIFIPFMSLFLYFVLMLLLDTE